MSTERKYLVTVDGKPLFATAEYANELALQELSRYAVKLTGKELDEFNQRMQFKLAA